MEATNKIRSFIAIEINPSIQQKLKDIQDALRLSGADVKWVKSKNIHLTLKFLGEVEKNKIPLIIETLTQQLRGLEAFQLQIKELGAFPEPSHPKIIWIKTISENNVIKKIAEKLEAAFKELRFPSEEKIFHPHITLGRVRSSQRKFGLIKLLKLPPPIPLLEQTIDSIVLFESTLTAQGPIYLPLKRISLS